MPEARSLSADPEKKWQKLAYGENHAGKPVTQPAAAAAVTVEG